MAFDSLSAHVSDILEVVSHSFSTGVELGASPGTRNARDWADDSGCGSVSAESFKNVRHWKHWRVSVHCSAFWG